MIDIAQALIFGLWGAATVLLAFALVSSRFEILSQRQQVQMAGFREQLATKNAAQFEAVLKQVLDRPAQAIMTDDQVGQISLDIYNRIVRIQEKLRLN